ncbi:winged helix-turn-helix domain-containing protein [Enterococcus sp. DIV0187]|uniref:winged helix-turn-helix domain-containing protein n=1 Tax=Enterococcus sp. DIV0187 TaxID=2774644 RepID=UPI003F220743
MVKAILITIQDSEEEKLFQDLVNVLDEFGVVIQEYKEINETITIGELYLNPSNLCVRQKNKPIEFTYREFYLLYHLAKYPGVVFSKDHLYEILWQQYSFPDTINSSVSALVSKVRKKLSNKQNQIEYIQTVRDVGYRFNPNIST